MIASVEFSYAAGHQIHECVATREAYDTVARCFDEHAPDFEKRKEPYTWPRSAVIEMETDGAALSALGIRFEVVRFRGTMPVTDVVPSGTTTVHIRVPDIGLLLMNEVDVLGNACTDELQRRLNSGWRILCVCPPNEARRPSYILGRQKRDEE